MDDRHRNALIKAARNSLDAHLGRARPAVDPFESAEELLRPAGAFVTLHRRGELRGCIGTFDASRPLIETVRTMAISAGTRDPRFPPVSAQELDDVIFEISVLSAPRPARADEVQVGRHGLCVIREPFRGVLLPQVATEYGWTAHEFLAHTCRKAGLPMDAWSDPRTQIEVFEAEVFSEQSAQFGVS